MSLHTKTKDVLTNITTKLSIDIATSVDIILSLIEDYSAISDINYLLSKSKQKLSGIELPLGEPSWLPIRNLARIIAKIISIQTHGEISEINIESMSCGCDYFEGNIIVTIDGEKFGGPYKWQWTAFSSRERSYEQFTTFPDLQLSHKIIQN